MIKKIYLFFAITLLGPNFDITTKSSSIILKEKSIKKTISQLKKDLKELKINNPNSPQIQQIQDKISKFKQDLKQLRKKEITSNTFFNKTSHIEARTSVDTMHAQDIYHAKYLDTPLEPTDDPHEQLGGYFRNH